MTRIVGSKIIISEYHIQDAWSHDRGTIKTVEQYCELHATKGWKCRPPVLTGSRPGTAGEVRPSRDTQWTPAPGRELGKSASPSRLMPDHVDERPIPDHVALKHVPRRAEKQRAENRARMEAGK